MATSQRGRLRGPAGSAAAWRTLLSVGDLTAIERAIEGGCSLGPCNEHMHTHGRFELSVACVGPRIQSLSGAPAILFHGAQSAGAGVDYMQTPCPGPFIERDGVLRRRATTPTSEA